MEENQKRISDHHAAEGVTDSSPTGKHPEWHPFAVWQTQILQERVSVTGQHRILQSVKVADA